MKVLGEAGNRKLLLEATEDEVAQIIGYNDHYDYKRANNGYAIHAGKDIDVGAIHKHMFHIRHAETSLQQAKAQLDMVSAGLLLGIDKLHTAIEPQVVIPQVERDIH